MKDTELRRQPARHSIQEIKTQNVHHWTVTNFELRINICENEDQINIQKTALTIGRFTKRRQMYFFIIQNLAFAIVGLVNSRQKMDFRICVYSCRNEGKPVTT